MVYILHVISGFLVRVLIAPILRRFRAEDYKPSPIIADRLVVTYGLFVRLAGLGPEAIFLAGMYKAWGVPDPRAAVMFTLCAVCSVGWPLLFIPEAFFRRLEYNAKEILEKRPFRAARTFRWAKLTSIRVHRNGMEELVFGRSQKLSVPLMMIGRAEFYELAHEFAETSSATGDDDAQ